MRIALAHVKYLLPIRRHLLPSLVLAARATAVALAIVQVEIFHNPSHLLLQVVVVALVLYGLQFLVLPFLPVHGLIQHRAVYGLFALKTLNELLFVDHLKVHAFAAADHRELALAFLVGFRVPYQYFFLAEVLAPAQNGYRHILDSA